jgi:acetyltransferase-like isoleucine patch superfamily enzyme
MLKSVLKNLTVRQIAMNVFEVYVGGILKLFPGLEGIYLRRLFYRLLFRTMDPGLNVYPYVTIYYSYKISAGSNLSINTGTYIDAGGGIIFGDNVMIGPNCTLSSRDHGIDVNGLPMREQPYMSEKIIIGDDVWIGANVFIRRGITIGYGAVIAAGSVVTENVPPMAVFGGPKGRVIKMREKR